MKRLIAAGLLFFVVGALCFADMKLSNHIYDTISEDIKKCSSAFEQKDYDTAVEYAKKLEENWVEHEDIFSVFINHRLIDEMGEAVAKLVPLAKNQDVLFLTECRIVQITLKHIKDDSSISWHSVF